MTLGAEAEERAFRNMWARAHRKIGWWMVPGVSGQRNHDVRERELLRYAFAAGVRYGLSLRGCCETHDNAPPEGVD